MAYNIDTEEFSVYRTEELHKASSDSNGFLGIVLEAAFDEIERRHDALCEQASKDPYPGYLVIPMDDPIAKKVIKFIEEIKE